MSKQHDEVVVVTGGAGFIGSNFLNTIVPIETSKLFINLDCLTYAGDLDNVTVEKEANYLFTKVDICDKSALARVFAEHKPTAVVHFAAESHVDVSIEKPDIFIATNVMGTNNLLELAKQHDCRRFHHISTDEVYGAFESAQGRFKETDKLDPRSPYSASKAAAELLVNAFNVTYRLPTVITRCCNVYGPRQDTSKLIPRFITKLHNNEKVPLYGEGRQIREWIYIDDCIAAISAVFRQGLDGEVYNIGTGEELTNLEVTEKLLTYFQKDFSYIAFAEDRLGHDFRYALDVSKITNELGWKPQVPFTEGLDKTINYYTTL